MQTTRINFIKQYLATLKIPPNTSEEDKRFLNIEPYKFTIVNSELYKFSPENYRHQLVINQVKMKEVLYQYHQHPLGGHLAYSNTLNKISIKYYWENMQKDIYNYVKNCHRCQRMGSKTINERLHPIEVRAAPFDQIALDVKHVSTSRAGHRYIIAAIDYLTKWVEARAIMFQTASEIALFLYEEIICRHGTPTVIITDNGKPFISELVQQVCHHY